MGNNDLLIHMKDIETLENKLTIFGIDYTMKKYDVCGHLTFLWGKNESYRIFRDIEAEIVANTNRNKEKREAQER